MKDFIPVRNRDYLTNHRFITHYDIDNDEIIVHYSNNLSDRYPYSKEKEEEILNILKQQVELGEILYSGYKQSYECDTALASIYNAFMIGNIMVSSYMHEPTKDTLLAFVLAPLVIINAFKANDSKEKKKEIEKYKFFIENQDIINDEIKKVFDESDDTYGYEENLISLNDLDNYTIQELKEMVELINKTKQLVLK